MEASAVSAAMLSEHGGCRSVMSPSNSITTHQGLSWLVSQLDALPGLLDENTARRLLGEADLGWEEVSPYVEERADTYMRRCVVRRENYELLVLTWRPGQGSVAHDHSGSLCGLRVVRGCLTEELFDSGPDGQVRKTTSTRLEAGEVIVDPGVVVHTLRNATEADELLVTVHIYSPPLPEVRRYAVAQEPPAALFLRRPSSDAQVIAILGGGFTGAMTLANLLRHSNARKVPLHVVMIDRQAAIGEGIAYRTNDSRHLLNVPASRMSAWPDRPDDFLNFAQSNDPAVRAGDFLPRKAYGQYIRQTLSDLAEVADGGISAEVVRDDATKLTPSGSSGWTIQTRAGRTVEAHVVVCALGHRPPDDVFGRRWAGPRTRLVANPWAALVLSQIGPNESVLVLGSGLTAVDAILTLGRTDRSAPIIVVSRRGLMPLSHLSCPRPAADVSDMVSRWLNPAVPLTTRELVRSLRRRIAAASELGIDWRQVIDGLRPAIPSLWNRLNPTERSRFIAELRPFWEVHRHRMSPQITDTIDRFRRNQTLEVTTAALVGASADADGVDITFFGGDGCKRRRLRVSWVINCTGPGVHDRHSTHPILRPLLEEGILTGDELGLGLRTDDVGRAIDASGQAVPTLLITGTLRKATLWESTAVPELRQQAQIAAQTALATLSSARA
jgi:uncharacterized NAD(P)/FAD-binding protein YdhS